MRVFTSIELAPEATKNTGNQTFNIINNEPQREKHAAYQFFRSLLVLLCYKKASHKKDNPRVVGAGP